MKNIIKDIIQILNEECRFHQHLLELSKEKTNMINEGRIQELEALVKKEENLILRIGQLDAKRAKLLDILVQEKEIEPDKLTISHLISIAEQEDSNRLEVVRDTFEAIIDEQRQLNQINGRLIQSNLDFISYSMDLLTMKNETGNLYHRDGELSSKSQKLNLFDTKV